MSVWVRHKAPPWERNKRSAYAYGRHLSGHSWIVVEYRAVRDVPDGGDRHEGWCVVWCIGGRRTPGTNLAVLLFITRCRRAALALADLWIGHLEEGLR